MSTSYQNTTTKKELKMFIFVVIFCNVCFFLYLEINISALSHSNVSIKSLNKCYIKRCEQTGKHIEKKEKF